MTEREKRVWRICYNDVSYKAWITSNMTAHIKRKHAISLCDSSHNTVSSSIFPYINLPPVPVTVLSVTLVNISSAKSKFSSNSQKSQNILSHHIRSFFYTHLEPCNTKGNLMSTCPRVAGRIRRTLSFFSKVPQPQLLWSPNKICLNFPSTN